MTHHPPNIRRLPNCLVHYNYSNGIETKANIIEFETVHDSDGNTYKPIFEFLDRSGNKTKYDSDVSYGKLPFQIGDKVKIVYNSKDTTEVKIVLFWGLYLRTILSLSFAAPFLIIGGGYILYEYV